MVDLKKLIGVVVIGFFPPFIIVGGPILLPILYLYWRYFRFCFKMDLIVIYLLIRLPIWLLIQLPLYSIGVVSGKVESFFVAGLNKLRRARKTSAFLLLLFLPAYWLLISPQVSMTQPQFFNVVWWFEIVKSLSLVVFSTVFTVILFLSIKESLSGNIAQGEMPAAWATGEMAGAPGQAVDNTIEGMQNTREVYQQGREYAEKAKKAKGAFNEIKSGSGGKKLLSSDIEATLGELAEMFGLGGEAAAGEAAAGGAAEAGLASNPIGWAIIGIILLALLFFVVQMAAVVAIFGFMLKIYAPLVLGPLAAALGIGADYGNWLGTEFADRVLAGLNLQIDIDLSFLQEIKARLACVAQGPGCVRQYLANDTKSPDSNNVGETYKLQLDRFEVGSGEQVDIAGYNGDYKLPISFGLSNTRNGIYGIPALNVSYRLSMIDFQRSGYTGEPDPYCQTGWRPIQGYNIRNPDDPAKVEVPGQDEPATFAGNDLYPGTSASTGFVRLEDFSLENCGLLQPGAGETKTVMLEVKYDYSSQATLYFEAMSRQVLQQRPEIHMKWKASETADTPVKSVLNVNSPVLYDEDELGTGNAAQSFDMRTTLTTEQSGVEYKIEDLTVIKSEEVEILEDESNCQMRKKSEDSSVLVPAGNAQDIIESGEWFSDDNRPPFFGCSMELSNPADINPAGQTLSMDVMSNYTVKLNQKIERFRILNSKCGTQNCPFLVTTWFAERQEKPKNWKVQCTGPDSSEGCEVVQGDPDNWNEIEYMTGHQENQKLDSKLEQGEYAYDPFAEGVVYENTASELKQKISYDSTVGAAIGLSAGQIEKIEGRTPTEYGFAVLSVKQEDQGVRTTTSEREVIFERLPKALCRDEGGGNELERYKKRIGEEDPFGKAYLISFKPAFTRCEDDSTSSNSTDYPTVGY